MGPLEDGLSSVGAGLLLLVVGAVAAANFWFGRHDPPVKPTIQGDGPLDVLLDARQLKALADALTLHVAATASLTVAVKQLTEATETAIRLGERSYRMMESLQETLRENTKTANGVIQSAASLEKEFRYNSMVEERARLGGKP